MKKKIYKRLFYVITLIIFIIISVLISLFIGEVDFSFSDIPKLFSSKDFGIEISILKNIRLPRIMLGLAVGGALGLSGAILQGIYKNPLVEPYTLGISGGAALGVALTIVLGLQLSVGTFMLPVSGFVGAVLIVTLVYTFSVSRGKISTQSMLLTGVMISFISSSAMMLLMAITTSDNLHGIIFWIMGSLDEPNNNLVIMTAIVSISGLIISYLFVQSLNALRLGEEKAKYLGINTDLTIKLMFLLASLLTGVCVAVAGIIGFVGLIIPHLIRLVVGNDFRIFLISSFLGGAAFLVLCDTFARTIISPNELPIGVITGIIGGSIFIVVLSRSSKKRMYK